LTALSLSHQVLAAAETKMAVQFHDVRAPQPEIWSPIALPTVPAKKPTIGPKAYPKNGTSANAGLTDTVLPGIGSCATSRIP